MAAGNRAVTVSKLAQVEDPTSMLSLRIEGPSPSGVGPSTGRDNRQDGLLGIVSGEEARVGS